MLSILIPVYNFDVRTLVKDLHAQCETLAIAFEIICLDDGSTFSFKEKNKNIATLPYVTYTELAKNLGRSKIRNRLGKLAKYNSLLFMDCDAQVNHDTYIKQYVDKIDNKSLLYGGRSYATDPPNDLNFFFHWYYGKHREQTTPTQRVSRPYHSFMTNNFLIPKTVFLSILFDESLLQYGHEDTIFGLELMQKKVPMIHLDNPLEHIGLENFEVFLKKTNQAIENLYKLSLKNDLIETRLLQIFKKTRWIHPVFLFFYYVFEKTILKNLQSEHPNLKLFDFYKLVNLVKVHRKG